MPDYFYVAKSFDGEKEAGVLNAQDEFQLARLIRSKGFLLIKAMPEIKKEKFKFRSKVNLSFSILPISLTEKIVMVRNLGVMIEAGLSLVKSFDVLSEQTKHAKLKKALADIKEKINKGWNLSDALSQHPKIFSELFTNMIKVGEESGTLDEIFRILSFQLEKEHELRSKIRNAMIYPSVILMVMFIVGIIIITFVIPNLKVFFSSLNVEIPIYTRAIIGISDFLAEQWILSGSMVFTISTLIFLFARTKLGKKIIDYLLLEIPIISPIVKKNNSAFFIRSLSSLIVAGVPLTRALEISSKTVKNHFFRNAATDAEEKIKKGWKLSNALKLHQDIFPLGVTEIVEVGEETGKSSTILKKLADFYEKEAIDAVEKLSILIEPILIIILGLGVGIFAFSIIQPMYSSLQSIT